MKLVLDVAKKRRPTAGNNLRKGESCMDADPRVKFWSVEASKVLKTTLQKRRWYDDHYLSQLYRIPPENSSGKRFS